MIPLQQQFDDQQFSNGYELVNGVTMHRENPDHFQIPPDVIKRNVRLGHFVEVRLDSPRFSVHDDAVEKCTCAVCHGEMSKPILRHNHPTTLLPLPPQNVPSRGWGEDFWVRIVEREGHLLRGVIDNRLFESRLHGLNLGNEILFHEDHMLAVHDIHRPELVAEMDLPDLKELSQWLADNNGSQQ